METVIVIGLLCGSLVIVDGIIHLLEILSPRFAKWVQTKAEEFTKNKEDEDEYEQ